MGRLQRMNLALATHPSWRRGGSTASIGPKNFVSSQVTGRSLGLGKQM